MRDFFAGALLLASMAVFTVSLIAMFRPLPKIHLGTRKSAFKGFGVGFALFVLTAIVIPAPPPEPEAVQSDKPAPKKAMPSPPAYRLSEEQSAATDFARSITINLIACSMEADPVQSKIDKVASGALAPVDAFIAARTAEKSCRSSVKDIGATDVSKLSNEAAKIARQAKTTCALASENRADAFESAQIALDGASGLTAAADYREKLNMAKGDDIACRMTLEGLAENLGIPESKIDFLK